MAEGYMNTVIKSVTYTGTTNSIGLIYGGLSDFGITDGYFIIGAYMHRGDFDVFRNIEVGAYGNAGYSFHCTEGNGTDISAQSVSMTIYYI